VTRNYFIIDVCEKTNSKEWQWNEILLTGLFIKDYNTLEMMDFVFRLLDENGVIDSLWNKALIVFYIH